MFFSIFLGVFLIFRSRPMNIYSNITNSMKRGLPLVCVGSLEIKDFFSKQYLPKTSCTIKLIGPVTTQEIIIVKKSITVSLPYIFPLQYINVKIKKKSKI